MQRISTMFLVAEKLYLDCHVLHHSANKLHAISLNYTLLYIL